MANSCRGILIAGLTNRARTQMAEGILRYLTAGTVFVKSGGVHHESAVHPLAIKAMNDIGVDISGHSVTSLQSARRQQGTYDVHISIDCSYEQRTIDKSLPPRVTIRRKALRATSCTEDDLTDSGSGRASCEGDRSYGDDSSGDAEYLVEYDPLLVPSTPSHWSVGADATDIQRQWKIWSPRDPSIFHENSTRKFQDHIYEGEPLFMQLKPCRRRTLAKLTERWEMEEVAVRYPMERRFEQELRFAQARTQLLQRCVSLLRRMEEHYGEQFLLNTNLLRTPKIE
uniref:Uncharacterized protein TCIL3000_9_1030 n=1 Tax=Trypanosoma congolense (strain IL3000) TaxID=1068625 RepID=G0UTJ4_TRYCI|nr:unnamed protein product [Trypanosoma congolense IL3000]